MSTFTLAILFDHFQFALIHGRNIPGSFAILLFTASNLASITSHIHNWVLLGSVSILSGVISPLISSSSYHGLKSLIDFLGLLPWYHSFLMPFLQSYFFLSLLKNLSNLAYCFFWFPLNLKYNFWHAVRISWVLCTLFPTLSKTGEYFFYK